MNAGETVKQWTDVHGLSSAPTKRDRLDGHVREIWRDAAGLDAVESITVAGLAHGTPLAAGAGPSQCGQAGPFLIEAGISSTWHIARFFGLTADAALKSADRPGVRTEPAGAAREREVEPEIIPPYRPGAGHGAGLPIDVGAVIQKALQSAGLLKRGP
jgi:feruloyl esterase